MNLVLQNAISPFEEMLAYEVLWGQQNQSLKSLASLFRKERSLPSELLKQSELFGEPSSLLGDVKRFLQSKKGFSVSVNGTFQYPQKLREAKYPIELFYYRGDIGLLESRCISVVGSRKATDEGKLRTQKLTHELVRQGMTIVSGLAVGIDTVALRTSIDNGGSVIGVIGTPIDEYYPAENRELQELIAKEHLLISQVPFYRYATEPFQAKKYYFPQRNETMSAISEATIIVEASETSGTLTQARASLSQGRKLFILNSCFEKDLTWPHRFAAKGAVRVRQMEDIYRTLGIE